MSTQEPTEQELVDAIYQFAAEHMQAGKSNRQVEGLLVERGLQAGDAAAVVSNLSRARSEAIRSAGGRNMLFGALWCIGGTVVTVATLAASSEGGTYVVAWGAILFGGIQFLRGLFQLATG